MKMTSTAITNVRVFDGQGLTEARTVVLEDGRISAATSAETTVDGQGGTLLPGLIDTHVHLQSAKDLALAAHWGVTTMLDMGARPLPLLRGLRGLSGLSDIRSAGTPASAKGGVQTTRMGFDASSVVADPDDAERFVAERIADGSDYIKIIVEDPAVMRSAALTPATVAALVKAAHAHHLRTYAHLTSVPGMQIAIDAGVDVHAHAPLDGVASAAQIAAMRAAGTISTPTLVMMQGVANRNEKLPTHRAGVDFKNSQRTVTALREAGVPTLAGTDANSAPGSPFNVLHGEALHRELSLLVEAGLTPVEALRAATILPAQLLDLGDRGAVEPGRRADLVLVTGDPTKDVAATRNIQGVWIAGVRVR